MSPHQSLACVAEAAAEEEEEDGADGEENSADGFRRQPRAQAAAHLMDRVERMAEAHHSYATLTSLCELDGDADRLHDHMLR